MTKLHYIHEAKPLTLAESHIAKLLLTSRDLKSIAASLAITLRTVKAHAAVVYRKTNTVNRIEYMAQHITTIGKRYEN